MKKDEIYEVIDSIRDSYYDDDIAIKLCNFLEANIDAFIECYDDYDDDGDIGEDE